MAKKICINPIKIENICVPSDILKECELTYSNFKKMYAKYAPGKLAFFKFNSTIVDNLNNLKNKGCSDIYKISVYQSYFRNCNNIENIVKTTGKILSKLDSLLEAIGTSENETSKNGTSKKASLSTLGVKGLFTKKRKNDDKLNEYYNYFNNLAANMRTTINNHNFINTEKSATKFEILNHASNPGNHQSISIDENLSRNKVKEEMKEKLKSIKLDFFLTKSDISKYVNNKIPSYAKVMSRFLNDAITEYNNLYEIQHKLKDVYDLKGSSKNDYYDNIKEIKSNYKTYAGEIKNYKMDLDDSIKYLQDHSKKFQKHWDKKARKTTIDITNIEKDMRELCNKIKNNDKDIRGKLKKNNDNDSKKYSSMLKKLSSSMKIAADNISRLADWVTNQGEYADISHKLSPALRLTYNFNAIKSNIAEYLDKFTSNDKINADRVQKSFANYLNSFEQIKQEYLRIRNIVLGVYTIDVKKLNYDINRKEKQAHFDRIKNKVSVAASATGVGISILSALMRLIG